MIGTTNPGETTELVHEFDHDGTLTGALVGTEVGQEYGLRIYAEVIRDGSPENLWNALDRAFLAGNGRDYRPRIRMEVAEGHALRIRAVNVSDEHEYHHAVMVNYDREGPVERMRNALMGVL